MWDFVGVGCVGVLDLRVFGFVSILQRGHSTHDCEYNGGIVLIKLK
jgi:hypothetical protein